MKKILIGIGIVAVLLIVIRKCTIIDPPNKWVNNEVSTSYPDGTISEPSAQPSKAEIFIDASGSMKPYFKEKNPAIKNTLSKIQNVHGQPNTDIFFCGDKKPRGGYVDDIIREIQYQPNDITTLFHYFFKDVAAKVDTTDVIVYLLTDGIMSVGNTPDMTAKMVQLEGLVSESFKGQSNLACAIYRYTGEYNGPYWDRLGKTFSHDGTRPYYIIALGKKEAIRWLKTQKDGDLNSPEGKLFVGIHDFKAHQEKAVLALGDSVPLEDMNSDTKLILDLPACLKDIDSEYVKSHASITIGGKNVKIPIEKDEMGRIVATISPTVPVQPDPDGGISATLTIENAIPDQWLTTWSTDDDTAGPDATTTFGLSYLIKGIVKGIQSEDTLLTVKYHYYLQ